MEQKNKQQSKERRRKWAAGEKIEVLRSQFGRGKLVDTCEQYRVHPNQLNRWWKTVLEAGAEALSGEGKRLGRDRERLIKKYEDELLRKDRVIVALTEELIEEKKSAGAG